MAYQEINEIFQQHDIGCSPSEAHGIATAMLCVDARAGVNSWLDELFEDEIALLEEEKAALLTVFERTRRLLNPDETEFEFDLFFPDNDDLQEHAIALSEWCLGFLWGIGYSHSAAHWSGETDGILKDMVEITKLEQDVDRENDEDAAALMQIHEYLRAAVLIIRDELSSENNMTEH